MSKEKIKKADTSGYAYVNADSARDAAIAKGKSYGSLLRKLKGRIINNTSMVYV